MVALQHLAVFRQRLPVKLSTCSGESVVTKLATSRLKRTLFSAKTKSAADESLSLALNGVALGYTGSPISFAVACELACKKRVFGD